jgi:hypothetical protein
VRLRISCDIKYPGIIRKIEKSLQAILPNAKTSLVKRKANCKDISCYSNSLLDFLPWDYRLGPKHAQPLKIPTWITVNTLFIKHCLCGLIQTDGSIYSDRGYLMVNFTTVNKELASDFIKLIGILGFECKKYEISKNLKRPRFTIRITKRVSEFIKLIALFKN